MSKIVSQKLKPSLSDIANTDYLCMVDGGGELMGQLYNYMRIPELDNMWVSEYNFENRLVYSKVVEHKDVFDDRGVQDIIYKEMKRRAEWYKYDDGGSMSIMNADGKQVAYFY